MAVELTIATPTDLEEWESPSVSLQEAAERLGLTESEVLLRVFRGSLPSHLDGHGGRRVPLAALDAIREAEATAQAPPELAPLIAQVEALEQQLRDARRRIAALEEGGPAAPPSPDDRLASVLGELRAAQSRIAALESRIESSHPPWLRHWEACCRLLRLTT
jgi:hypothetical protein